MNTTLSNSTSSHDNEPLDSWLTQRQVAAHLDISQRTLERMRSDGVGPRFSRAGKRILYHRDDVEAWLRKHSFNSTSEAKHPNNITSCEQ
ncbi:MAG: helix-turn-helix domain-containing protein [Hyphomicrobiaceae bacterium]